MTLENLVGTRQLQEHTADSPSVQRLLESARRNLADAQVVAISDESRFDAAYKCIMQCAMLGLWANGYRTSTSQPGHHQTAIQTLPLTIGYDKSSTFVLDSLRKQRNTSDYLGDTVSVAVLASALEEAAALLAHTQTWLRSNHPGLLAPD
jgi:hypothetical protein